MYNKFNYFYSDNIMKKIIDVINSIESILHIESVRQYIDLYYHANGVEDKEIIETHFLNRIEELKKN
jgi:hypothetical protein